MSAAILCFSHLRWNFVYQRPQHLLSRFAKRAQVFYFEEPIVIEGPSALRVTKAEGSDLTILTPHINNELADQSERTLSDMIFKFVQASKLHDYICWYYSPMALGVTDQLKPVISVFDCMDELSAFKFAPAELKRRESQLLSIADVVFTGGYSLYSAKRDRHNNIFPFPSSIDKMHFESARSMRTEPSDMKLIPRPRFGFYGVIDERFDIELIAEVADRRPEWQIIILGPVVKIDPNTLPQRKNIHYLSAKKYDELPAYLSSWDVAIMPFAMNESTRYISPTKTPEYLAAGKPVISTPIADVMNDYGGLVSIAASAEEFVAAGDHILQGNNYSEWLERVDRHLANNSWDDTWQSMSALIEDAYTNAQKITTLTY